MSGPGWRIPSPLDAAADHAFSAAVSGFYTGRCLAELAAWGAGVVRLRLTLARVDVLRSLGRDEAALAVSRAAMERIERRRRARRDGNKLQ